MQRQGENCHLTFSSIKELLEIKDQVTTQKTHHVSLRSQVQNQALKWGPKSHILLFHFHRWTTFFIHICVASPEMVSAQTNLIAVTIAVVCWEEGSVDQIPEKIQVVLAGWIGTIFICGVRFWGETILHSQKKTVDIYLHMLFRSVNTYLTLVSSQRRIIKMYRNSNFFWHFLSAKALNFLSMFIIISASEN